MFFFASFPVLLVALKAFQSFVCPCWSFSMVFRIVSSLFDKFYNLIGFWKCHCIVGLTLELCAQRNPAGLIRSSVLTGLIFTWLRSVLSFPLYFPGPLPSQAGCLVWRTASPPAAAAAGRFARMLRWGLGGAVWHGWFHTGSSNSSPGLYRVCQSPE